MLIISINMILNVHVRHGIIITILFFFTLVYENIFYFYILFVSVIIDAFLLIWFWYDLSFIQSNRLTVPRHVFGITAATLLTFLFCKFEACFSGWLFWYSLMLLLLWINIALLTNIFFFMLTYVHILDVWSSVRISMN